MKRIGIIGGGQLGKMMILDGKRLDCYFVILDPTKNCPAHSIADEHIVAQFDDREAFHLLAEKVDVVTYEFEHINLNALEELEREGHKVIPSSETLSRIQHKGKQKKWLSKWGVPVPLFKEINSYEEIKGAAADFGYPLILKTCTGGYDGKGNAVIEYEEDIDSAYKLLGSGDYPLMVEEWIPFEKEVSILACRSISGEVSVFPVAENIHINSILDETLVPAKISEEANKEAFLIAKDCIEAVNAYGMLCIELFITKEGRVLVNELAPRPHNSGHYTIEGCYTSQYEQHIRGILGLPLGNSEYIRPTVMKNIIGKREGKANIRGLEKAYENPNVKVHIYGKEYVGVGRKMGHITATGTTLEEALVEVRRAYDAITV